MQGRCRYAELARHAGTGRLGWPSGVPGARGPSSAGGGLGNGPAEAFYSRGWQASAGRLIAWHSMRWMEEAFATATSTWAVRSRSAGHLRRWSVLPRWPRCFTGSSYRGPLKGALFLPAAKVSMAPLQEPSFACRHADHAASGKHGAGAFPSGLLSPGGGKPGDCWKPSSSWWRKSVKDELRVRRAFPPIFPSRLSFTLSGNGDTAFTTDS